MLTMRRMSHLAPEHEHAKAYSGETLPLIDRWFWICTDCLDAGSDKLPEEPAVDGGAYWGAMRRLNPECWIPATFRKTLG